MKNRKGLIAFIIIGIVIVIAGVLLVFLLPKKSNKQIFTDALGKSLGLVSSDGKEIGDIFDKLQEKVEKSNYKLTINIQNRQDEAGYAKGKEVIYFGNKKAYFTGSMTSNDLTSNFEAMLKDDKLYFNMKDLLSKVYYIDKIDEFLASSNKGDSFFGKIEEYLIDSFIESLNNKEVVNETTSLTINGTKYKTTLYAYTFTGETLYDTVVGFAKKIKNDKDFYKQLNEFIKTSGMSEEFGNMEFSKDMLDATIDQLLSGAEALKSLGKLATYSVYMYNDQVIGTKVEVQVSEKPMTIEYYSVVNNDKKYIKYVASEGNVEMYNFVLDEKTKGNSEIALSMNGEEVAKGYLKESDGDYEVKLYDTEDGDNYILININKNNTGTIKVVSDINTLNIDYKLEQVDEIPEMDIKGSTSIDDMTETDKQILESFFSMLSPKSNYVMYDESLDM